MEKKHEEANKEIWNSRVEAHVNSDFYDNKTFLDGRNSLNKIERKLLGDVSGKRILHLQCHFGQDSLSLARMGAHVTGVDISIKAIEQARVLNDKLGLDAKFVCCNVLEIDQHLEETFDIIFTSYGTIGWIPELTKYFNNVSRFLKPNGIYHITDFHPVYWMFDGSYSKIAYSYFNTQTIVDEEEGSYASAEANPKMKEYGWNHPLSEIFEAALNAGLNVKLFKEYDFSPYNLFKESTQNEDGYQIKGLEGKMPLTYSLVLNKT